MSTSRVDLNKLVSQSEELYNLIHATNGILNDPNPISELRVNYQKKVSSLGPQVVNFAKAAVATRKSPRELIPVAITVAAVTAVGWTGAAGIDLVRNGMAKSQAKRALLGYYEQLAVKQNMIIEAQQQNSREMAEVINKLSENEEEYREKIRALQARQEELTNLVYRFNALKQLVEK